MSRRGFWLGLGILCLALVCVARAEAYGSQVPESQADAVLEDYVVRLPFTTNNYFETELTLWHMWGGDYLEEYQNIIDEFNTAHPDMTVKLVFVEDMSTTLSMAIPAGVGPDIIAYPNDRIAEWALAEYLAPLDDWIDLTYLTDNFEPAAVVAQLWNNQIWGIPEAQEGIALVYSKSLISEADLPASDDFAGLLAKAEAFRLSHPDQYYLCNQGLGALDSYHVAPIYFGHGVSAYGGYVDEEGIAYLDTAEALTAGNWINDFRPYAPVETSHGICRDMLVSGEAGIWWTGPWAIADLQNAGLDYGIASMGSPFVGVKSLLLTQAALERDTVDAAIYLMKYLGSTEVQKRLALTNHTIPANTDALHDPDVQAIYDIAQFGLAFSQGIPMANHIYSICQWDPVAEATDAIWNGTLAPTEALEAAQTAIETCVAGISPP